MAFAGALPDGNAGRSCCFSLLCLHALVTMAAIRHGAPRPAVADVAFRPATPAEASLQTSPRAITAPPKTVPTARATTPAKAKTVPVVLTVPVLRLVVVDSAFLRVTSGVPGSSRDVVPTLVTLVADSSI